MRKVFVLIGFLLGAAAIAEEARVSWQIDPAHSSVAFAVRHLMVSNVRGEFTQFSGTVTSVAQRPETAVVEVTIETSSINTRNADRDKHLRSADFLDVEKFPTITFKSKKVQLHGQNRATVVGDLTLHGVTKEVSLDVELSPVVKDPMGNLRVGAHAVTTIKRKDYGINWSRILDTGVLVVGDDVQVILDVELMARL